MMRSDARSQTAAKNRKRKRKEQTATSVVPRDNSLFHVLYPSDLAMYMCYICGMHVLLFVIVCWCMRVLSIFLPLCLILRGLSC